MVCARHGLVMERELTPDEEKELTILGKKMLHTAPPITEKEMERYIELSDKKYGTMEEREEEIRENRKNFLKLQEKLSKKLKR